MAVVPVLARDGRAHGAGDAAAAAAAAAGAGVEVDAALLLARVDEVDGVGRVDLLGAAVAADVLGVAADGVQLVAALHGGALGVGGARAAGDGEEDGPQGGQVGGDDHDVGLDGGPDAQAAGGVGVVGDVVEFGEAGAFVEGGDGGAGGGKMEDQFADIGSSCFVREKNVALQRSWEWRFRSERWKRLCLPYTEPQDETQAEFLFSVDLQAVKNVHRPHCEV